ncbi:MAG: autotransporter outer membrane beta-barrel domain-containing protein, partial [Ancalomicrobiaceae bacterium]|nr:autotransporter outer membrane beta-barrel domain-containing protein [Ancalomicrobiaceae bacterium]
LAGDMTLAVTTGSTTISGSNSYTGTTTIGTGGTLLANSTTALSSGSAFTLTGGTLDLNGNSNTIASLAGTGGTVESTGSLATLTTGDATSTSFAGDLIDGTGTLALTKVGAGTLTLSGTNSYSGATTVAVGTLQAGSTTAFSPTSAFTLSSGATLDLNGNSNTIASLAGTGTTATVTNTNATTATLTVGDGNDTSYAGAINSGTGALDLTKIGTGKLTLTGTSNLGMGTVTAGTLAVSATGSVTLTGMTVGANGTLTNDGTIIDTLDNFGTVVNTGIYTADATNEVGASLTNAGTWNGSIVNFGTLVASGTSSISGTVTNSSTMSLTPGATVTVGNLINSGTLMLGDGTTAMTATNSLTNRLTVTGSYSAIGANSLIVDANLTAGTTGTRAEELVVNTAASGTTNVTVNRIPGTTNGLLTSPITIADVTTAGGGVFTLTNAGALQYGPITYTLDATPSGGRTLWQLNSHLSGVGAIAASVGSAISAISTGFAEPTSAFVTGPSDPRQDQLSVGVWARTKGGQYDVGSTTTAGADTKASKMSSQFEGVQAGIDASISDIGGSNWSGNFGFTVGDVKVFSHDLLSATTSKVNIDAPFFGLYAVARGDGFYVDIQGQRNYYNLDLTNFYIAPSGTSLKGQGYSVVSSAGKVMPLYENWTIEPSIGFNYSSVTIGQLSTIAGILKTDTVESYIGSARLKVGTSFKAGDNLVLAPSVQGSVWHEFAGDATSTFEATGSTSIPISTSRVGTFGQIGVGLFGQILNTGASGFIRADYRAGDNVHGGSITAGLRYQF